MHLHLFLYYLAPSRGKEPAPPNKYVAQIGHGIKGKGLRPGALRSCRRPGRPRRGCSPRSGPPWSPPRRITPALDTAPAPCGGLVRRRRLRHAVRDAARGAQRNIGVDILVTACYNRGADFARVGVQELHGYPCNFCTGIPYIISEYYYRVLSIRVFLRKRSDCA